MLRRTTQQLAVLLVVLVWAGNAAAKDESIAGPDPGAPEPAATPVTAKPEAAKFDVNFGTSFTTDYVSRGITQSDSRPAIQGYIEPTYGVAYANVWSSNVDFGDDFRGAEIDVAGGLRPEIGKNLSLDFGWVHYFYAPEHVSPDYGEFFLKTDYKLSDRITFVTRTFFAPDFRMTLRCTAVSVFSFSRTQKRLRISPGLLAFPTVGSPGNSMSAIGTRTFPDQSALCEAALATAAMRGLLGPSLSI